MEIEYTTQVRKENETFVAYAPELDVSSCGATLKEAKYHLREAVEGFLEEAERMGTLQDILEEAGYVREEKEWRAPKILSTERSRLMLAR
jgi:predicted RNase H-like HicB family nuclease